MIVLSNSTAQTIQAGDSATFNLTVLHTGCGEQHRAGSGAVRLRPGLYLIAFTGNVGGAVGTQPALAVKVDGEALPETTMNASPAGDGDLYNVGCETRLRTCFQGTSVTVSNVGTTAVTLAANPALVVERRA